MFFNSRRLVKCQFCHTHLECSCYFHFCLNTNKNWSLINWHILHGSIIKLFSFVHWNISSLMVSTSGENFRYIDLWVWLHQNLELFQVHHKLLQPMEFWLHSNLFHWAIHFLHWSYLRLQLLKHFLLSTFYGYQEINGPGRSAIQLVRLIVEYLFMMTTVTYKYHQLDRWTWKKNL